MERLKVQIILDILYRLRNGQSERAIVRDLGCARGTIRRYHAFAQERGYLDTSQPLPEAAVLATQLGNALTLPQCVSTVEPYRSTVESLLKQGVEMVAIHRQLVRRHGYRGSYTSVRRFVRRLRPNDPPVWVRVETPPGQQAQVDFGGVGKLRDAATRKERTAFCFVMTLSYSRHQYVEFVFDQKIETWIGCHRRAFEWLGGTPKEIVVDNLKAAVLKAAFEDTVLSEPYRKMAQHYGFLVHPCRPRTPEHKGKVENGVHYVQRNFLAGERFEDLVEANAQVQRWVLEEAGLRDHGTTHEAPLKRFLREEQAALGPLPREAFTLLSVRPVKVHADCHVQLDGSYYSVPFRQVGKWLEAYVYEQTVQFYDGVRLIVTHPKAPRPGMRSTRLEDYPSEKAWYLKRTPDGCRQEARQVGSACQQVIEHLLAERPLDQLRAAQGVLRLSERYGAERLEAACARALAFETVTYRCIKQILHAGLETSPLAEALPVVSRRYAFARSWEEFFGEEGSAC